MPLCQMNQQSIGFLKQPANKIGANVMTLCQGPAVNDKVNKIEVEVDESPMNRTNLSFFMMKTQRLFVIKEN